MDSLIYKNFISNAIKISSENRLAKSLDTVALQDSHFTDIEVIDENFSKIKIGVHYAIAIYSRVIGYIDVPIDSRKYDTIDKFFSKSVKAQNIEQLNQIVCDCTDYLSNLFNVKYDKKSC